MIADAVRRGTRIGLVATFAGTLESMPAEFPQSLTVVPILVEGALAALNEGNGATHDRLAAAAARKAVNAGCDVVALAQFSLARAAPAVAEATRLPVLTTVESAVRMLRERVEG
jgi:Asp/Glu/hydantoin racemase